MGFLGSIWKLSDLPVAVVNLDEGAEYNGTELKAWGRITR